MIFHDNSHVISYLFFLKTRKNDAKLSSAAIVIGTLGLSNLLTLLCTQITLKLLQKKINKTILTCSSAKFEVAILQYRCIYKKNTFDL